MRVEAIISNTKLLGVRRFVLFFNFYNFTHGKQQRKERNNFYAVTQPSKKIHLAYGPNLNPPDFSQRCHVLSEISFNVKCT